MLECQKTALIMEDRNVIKPNSRELAHFFTCLDDLKSYVEIHRKLGLKIVLTDGTYDLIHVGHLYYLEKSRTYGDLLVVGVDSDEKTKARKGPDRPVIPQSERVALLRGFRCVDAVAVKEKHHPHWEMIKTVRPDVLIKSSSTKPYSGEELGELKEFCGRVEVLPPQATTSTSANVRRLQMGGAKKLADRLVGVLNQEVPRLVQETYEEFVK